MLFEGAEEARRRVEAGDVVVGRVSAVGGSDRRHLEYMCCCVLVHFNKRLREQLHCCSSRKRIDANLLVKRTPSLLGLVDQYREMDGRCSIEEEKTRMYNNNKAAHKVTRGEKCRLTREVRSLVREE